MPLNPRRILYEDEHLLAVNKLPRELSVAGKGKTQKLALLDFIKQEHANVTALHRLDFETSGVLLFAKQASNTARLAEQLFSDAVKTYVTLVKGRPGKKQGTITKPLPARTTGTVEAVTHYVIEDVFANSALVRVQIDTGRHHQIRRHLAMINHPLVLDHEYGHKKFNGLFTQEFGLRHLFLHASTLEFTHPETGERLTIEAPLPVHFVKILKVLKSI